MASWYGKWFVPSETLQLVKRVMAENVRRHWKELAKGSVCLAIVAGMTAAMAWLMAGVTNEIFVNRNAQMLWTLSALILVIFSIKGWATYLQATILARVGNRIVADNQQRIYDHLLKMPLSFFADRASSDLVMRLSYGAQAAREIVDVVVQSIGRDVLTLIGLLAVMFIQAPQLTLLALVVGPAAVWGILYLGERVKRLSRDEMISMAEIVATLQETTHGARILKAFGLERHMQDRMGRAVGSVEARANKIASLKARTAPLMETLTGLSIAAVICVSGWQAIRANGSPGEFMSFITALLLAYEPAKRLARLHVQLTNSAAAVQMMTQLLDLPPGRTETTIAPPLCMAEGRVEFRDVSFAYRTDVPVVRDVSFSVTRGQKVALVGPTGSGKSTIFHLLQRFYDVDDGSVLIDGQDVRQVSVDSVRAAISFVSQDTYL
ncbi:MAG: ATP-binding cassette, subfamily bacterial MsbA, partial [Variibacter sp.]|nr:ATP-binding cassette, subfamily bacterial MsbA [Variibacter sp.]